MRRLGIITGRLAGRQAFVIQLLTMDRNETSD